MITAQQVYNFQPQNPKFDAPRRIDVKRPTFEGGQTKSPFGLPNPKDVDGGIKYFANEYSHVVGAGKLNPFEQMYPCVISPALKTNIHIDPPPIADTYGYVAPYGQLRTKPKYIPGIASTPKREALLRQEPRPSVAVNSLIAPMMPNKI